MKKEQEIACCVTDCINCCNGHCQLNKILVSNDSKNEFTKHNTMCQSYEKKMDLW